MMMNNSPPLSMLFSPLLPLLFLLLFLLLNRFRIVQVGFKLTMEPRMTLDFCFHLPSAGVTRWVRCWGRNPGLPACWSAPSGCVYHRALPTQLLLRGKCLAVLKEGKNDLLCVSFLYHVMSYAKSREVCF